jgi:DNA polymerase-3 subunit delta
MKLFFYGTNAYALRKQLRHMVEGYVAKNGSDLGVERVDGATVKPQELAGALGATPFLSNSRLVIVESLSENKAPVDKLLAAIGKVPATTVAIFVDPRIDKRKVLFKEFNKVDKVVEFAPLAGARLTQWCAAEIARQGGTAAPGAVRELVELAGEDQWRLSEELAKLVAYSPEVTAENVKLLVERGVEQSIFDMVEAMTAGRVAAALEGYHRLVAARQSEIYVLTMVQWQLRNLLLAAAAPAGMPAADLARAAGMNPYVAGKMQTAARRHGVAALSAAFRAAADCEFDIKSGRLPGEAAVEQLIFRVASGYR